MPRIGKLPLPSRKDFTKRRAPAALTLNPVKGMPPITQIAQATPLALGRFDDGPLTLGALTPKPKRVKL